MPHAARLCLKRGLSPCRGLAFPWNQAIRPRDCTLLRQSLVRSSPVTQCMACNAAGESIRQSPLLYPSAGLATRSRRTPPHRRSPPLPNAMHGLQCRLDFRRLRLRGSSTMGAMGSALPWGRTARASAAGSILVNVRQFFRNRRRVPLRTTKGITKAERKNNFDKL